jgi:hypothetical protein
MPKTVLRSRPQVTRRGAVTPREWRALCQKALERARAVSDRRVAGLGRAIELNQEEKVLRSLGIVCEQDLDREF